METCQVRIRRFINKIVREAIIEAARVGEVGGGVEMDASFGHRGSRGFRLSELEFCWVWHKAGAWGIDFFGYFKACVA